MTPVTDPLELALCAAGVVLLFTAWLGLIGWSEISWLKTPAETRRSKRLRLMLLVLLPSMAFVLTYFVPLAAWVIMIGGIVLLFVIVVGALLAL